ncbi:hypothetical protein EC973_009069 [Apophysomyces ossiformis]|uniref:Uncharacterized protein n=1 Tax=Apophysomyces ossiformis TaxID=679940 RepID=A0A8H7BMQ9_9FUNG|nr:hypothetical protein EC973_009069 [Apophysomyces ossiformis]
MSTPGNGKRSAMDANKLTGREKRRESNRFVRVREPKGLSKESTDYALTGAPFTSKLLSDNHLATARLGEIKLMQSSIKSATYAINALTFQSLPSGLRRRAASHNVKRLPSRLRERAKQEMASSPPKKTKPKRKLRARRSKTLVEEYMKRQRHKRWLETHMWHTKRMKMMNLWGYRLAARPNTKSARTTYKSSTHLSILHDMSYMGCIELVGSFKDIVTVLDLLTDPCSPSVGSISKGQRVGHTNMYSYTGYPTNFICPVSFVWRTHQTEDGKSALWIWVHPAAFDEVYANIAVARDAVIGATPIYLAAFVDLELLDQRNELLRFDFNGPRSTALLQSVLEPVTREANGNRLWKDILHLRSSCSLPPGVVIGMTVYDPRFPQKTAQRTNKVEPETSRKLNNIANKWPADVAFSEIWNADVRRNVFENKLSEQTLNERRAQSNTSKLEPIQGDSEVPVLLIQRGNLAFHGSATSKPLSNAEVLEGWTLILPRGWGNAFWKSFVFAGARTCGFENIRQMQFESGFGSFPFDFPGTSAYDVYREQLKKRLETEWLARPPAKRVNHGKLGVSAPFMAAFENLEGTTKGAKCWLLQGEALIFAFLEGQETRLRLAMESMSSKRGLPSPQFQLENALFKIRVTYLDRRIPTVNAMIYVMEKQEEYDICTSRRRHREVPVAKSTLLERNHIGYVTNGGFSLTTGCGFGVGACTVYGVLKMREIDERQKRKVKMMVFVRNPNSAEGRPAQLDIIV